MLPIALCLLLGGAAASGRATIIAPGAPEMQYIGRMQDGPGGTKMFDMCVIVRLLSACCPCVAQKRQRLQGACGSFGNRHSPLAPANRPTHSTF